jgi:hypothetical protein
MAKLVFRTTLAAFVALAALLPARAALNCRDSDYQGVFGAIAVGNFMSAPGIPPGPTVRVGRVESDGNGNAKIQATLSLNGLIIKEDYGGTYAIHPDCSMDVTLLIPFPGVPAPIPFKFAGALADDGREAAIILLDPAGSDVRITLRKQRREDCTNRDLSGSYLLNMAGSIISREDAPAGFFGRVGRAMFDGKGKFHAMTQASYNGRMSKETLTGIYEVDSSCQVTIAYAMGEPVTLNSVDDPRARKFAGMLTDDGAGVDLMESEPAGASIIGTLRQQ